MTSSDEGVPESELPEADVPKVEVPGADVSECALPLASLSLGRINAPVAHQEASMTGAILATQERRRVFQIRW